MGPVPDVTTWIAREIVPREIAVRQWLARRWRGAVDVEDVIQEAYCRIAGLANVDHIDNPAAYFYRTAHSVAVDMLRRARTNSSVSMTQIDLSHVVDGEPLADRVMEANQELQQVKHLLDQLSDTARQAIKLRRLEGLSRKETAERLGISENDVKNHLVRGLQRVMKAMAQHDVEGDDPETVERKANRRG